MNVIRKNEALRALLIDRRMSSILGDGERTAEVSGAISVASKIARQAFAAGYKQARGEFLAERSSLARTKGHRVGCAVNFPPSPYDCDCGASK